jgi:hypothetical protein
VTGQYAALFAEPVPIGSSGEPMTAGVVAVPTGVGWRLTWFDGQYPTEPWGPTWPANKVRDAIAAAKALNRRRDGE